ncbi:hypothetical protein PC116_g21278 [Phytophthora cactorum]|uniref:P-type ATPase A domain-containing protein n=1 Tax=Phytophthora cactorum TaxID=29920 RepID=A0A8T1C6R3_9STRA|nr:hypothetical protein PC117_g17783 [Phytophthora cactorum]KAG3052482.1 hypothetical protein PC121_g17291 [Phytophthora cactorum]KAG3174615.1 hypothetical protein PC128_g18006 [Phytophthora cactorum]KAG4230434.1 hypothetical protein PC116_g21278 [Phytophthora cactorum]
MKELEDYQRPTNVADFVAEVGVDPALGLSRDDAMTRRALYGANRPPCKRIKRRCLVKRRLVYGDVVELKAGDVAGADLRVVECSDDCVVDQTTLLGDDGEDEEAGQGGSRKHVTTDTPPLDIQQDPLRCGNIVPMTASVLQGTAVAVVVSTGDRTLWGRMVTNHEWPPAPGTVLTKKEKGNEEEQTSLIV